MAKDMALHAGSLRPLDSGRRPEGGLRPLDSALSREEVKRAVEGRGAARRVPMAIHAWINPDVFGPRADECRRVLADYPCDIVKIPLRIPQVFDAPSDDPSYRWLNFGNPFPEGVALDAVSALDSWDGLGAALDDFPDPNYPGLIPASPPPDNGEYRVGLWWYWLFERLWSIRGMENALCDFYEHPDEVHRLFRALTDFYKAVLSRGRSELGLDAVWTSDDIGMQTSPFFSLDVFREFFKPYYSELIDHAHSLGMHLWMHCCGNIMPFIPDLCQIGLDVLHPIQKYTMDEKAVVAENGGKICFWAGMDLQRIMPYGSPEDVRREVRFMLDTYRRPDGRLILAAGNNMTADTPLENLRALLDEALSYGAE
ncbi:MAG: hypothetical protein LBL83_10025, partial [Clostridiales bacterium]|nr:hypothetical protein [Clostridiales bacterium]